MTLSTVLAFHWGNKALRGWAMSLGGEIQAEMTSEMGLAEGRTAGFEQGFRAECKDFLKAYPGAPVIIAGMVGSVTGWHEAPYAPCPISASKLIEAAVKIDLDGRSVMILPGAMFKDSHGNADVMRGEEVQLLGASQLLGLQKAVICIPGKHCKQAHIQNGQFTHFRSFVTGELFELLRDHSLVGALAQEGPFDQDAFTRGITHGAQTPLASAVFASRANALAGDLTPPQISAFLSGVLIGHETAQLKQHPNADVILMAAGLLADRYGLAMDILGIAHRRIDAQACMRAGLQRVAQHIAEPVA